MTVWRYCGLFSYQSFMPVATDTTKHENCGMGDCGPGTGNHKGCPYEGFVVTYFQGNDAKLLSGSKLWV